MKSKWEKTGIFLAVVLMLMCTACGKKTNTVVTSTPKSTESHVATGQAVTGSAVSGDAIESNESALEQKSRLLAKEIVAGLFEPLMEELSAEMSNQTTQASLESSWKSVVANLSGYVGIDAIEETKNAEYQIVVVTLRYADNQGRTIKFVYDTNEKISGLWFDAVTLQNQTDGKADGTFSERSISIGQAPYELKGKLTMPATGAKNAPVVILLGGRSDADMEGTIGAADNTPLKDIAQRLATEGIATFRFNRRAYQYKTLIPDDASGFELVYEDTCYAINQMFNNREIDSNRIYLLAQGEAAAYLPALVDANEKKLSGAVIMGGKPTKRVETYWQDDKEKTLVSDVSYFMKKNMTTPLFILQGGADYETPVTYFEKWQSLYKGRSHTTYRSFEGLNHLFMKTTGQTNATDYDTKNSVSTNVTDEIIQWIQDN